jgi:hypothetical protein
MARGSFEHRIARCEDLASIAALMDAAISELQKPFLDDAEIESSRAIMGLDTQLVDDGTYFVVELDGIIAGCGGWSRCATMYGGDQSPGRNAALLDPAIRCPFRPPHPHDLVQRSLLSPPTTAPDDVIFELSP